MDMVGECIVKEVGDMVRDKIGEYMLEGVGDKVGKQLGEEHGEEHIELFRTVEVEAVVTTESLLG